MSSCTKLFVSLRHPSWGPHWISQHPPQTATTNNKQSALLSSLCRHPIELNESGRDSRIKDNNNYNNTWNYSYNCCLVDEKHLDRPPARPPAPSAPVVLSLTTYRALICMFAPKIMQNSSLAYSYGTKWLSLQTCNSIAAVASGTLTRNLILTSKQVSSFRFG